jgi:hypothetical protein
VFIQQVFTENCGIACFFKGKIYWYHVCVPYKRFTLNYFIRALPLTSPKPIDQTLSVLLIKDLLGGRGWWLVKGALVRGPFLIYRGLSNFLMILRPGDKCRHYLSAIPWIVQERQNLW